MAQPAEPHVAVVLLGRVPEDVAGTQSAVKPKSRRASRSTACQTSWVRHLHVFVFVGQALGPRVNGSCHWVSPVARTSGITRRWRSDADGDLPATGGCEVQSECVVRSPPFTARLLAVRGESDRTTNLLTSQPPAVSSSDRSVPAVPAPVAHSEKRDPLPLAWCIMDAYRTSAWCRGIRTAEGVMHMGDATRGFSSAAVCEVSAR